MTYTREQIMAMTAEQLRVAIAEAKGWTDISYYDGPDLKDWLGITPDNHRLPKYQLRIPDWSRDIAAVKELLLEMQYCEPSIYYSVHVGKWGMGWRDHLGFNQFYDPVLELLISRAWLIWKTEAK